MDEPSSTLVELLLTTGRALALQLNDKLAVRVVHNAPLLVEWRGTEDAMPHTLKLLLEEMLPLPHAGELLEQITTAVATADEAGVALGTSLLRVPQGGGPDRFVAMSLHRAAGTRGMPLLLMRDVTASGAAQQSLARTQQSLDAALAMLRAQPAAIRKFLTQALTSIGDLRATMRLPARDQQAVRGKLGRLQEQAERLGVEASEAGVDTIATACANLVLRVTALLEQPLISGDALLPLAPLLDQVASSIGDCLRIEEQRHVPPTRSPAATAATQGPSAQEKDARSWARSAERGWSNFVRRIGEELGILVKLQVVDARLVPEGLRRDVDGMLQHLLRNAVEHGIETPEQRLAADKTVTGEVMIRFRDLGRQGMTMSVRDDGRGFDVERIGRAAVLSGVLSEESLVEYEPGEIVALIFKPSFSTANLEGEAGRGRGMHYLRRTVARLGGQISVATKPGIYTRVVIQLPATAR
jgi:signal transduction histidine kinase